MMTKYFQKAFAENGERTEIPEESVSGVVNYDDGFGTRYELPKTNPQRLAIERSDYNGLMHAVTDNLKHWQENGYPEIVADDGFGNPLSYPLGFVGTASGTPYVALVEGTATIPPSAEWQEYRAGHATSSTGTNQPIGEALDERIVYVDTVAQAVTLPLKIGQLVETKSRLPPTLGASRPYVGGNLYEVVSLGTGVDDGGSIITGDTFQLKGLFPKGVWAEQFGAKGDSTGTTGTDNLVAIQNALDYNEGGVVNLGASVYEQEFMIYDTLYIPPSTTLRGQTKGDTWGIYAEFPSPVRGTRIKLSPTEGTKRIWTDVGLPGTPAGTLVDDPISLGVAITGPAARLETLAIEGGLQSDGSDSWDGLVMTCAPTRAGFKGIELLGYAKKFGFRIDATWSRTNTALQDLHTNTYGRTVVSSGSSNEMEFEDCFFFAGNWGLQLKGTDRDDLSANVWSPGGVSDVVWKNCRVGNLPITPGGVYPLDSGAYYRDLQNDFQNRYFVGCSFRASSGTSIYLDRGRFENFIGMYAEFRADRLESPEVSLTVASEGVVSVAYTGEWPNSSPLMYRVYIEQSTRLDPIVDQLATSGIATMTTSTGSVSPRAFGYDSSVGKPYILTRSVTGTITAGQAITQAAGQDFGWGLYNTDRGEFVYCSGQTSLESGNPGAVSFYGAGGANISGNFRTEGLQSTGQVFEGGGTSEAHVNCEDNTQLNLWVNRHGTSESLSTFRLRYTGSAFFSYDAADLGTSPLRFNTGYFQNSPNVSSDARLKTDIQDVSAAEKRAAEKIKVQRFKMKSSVSEKGFDKARYHFGYIVQDVIAAFESEGLDPWAYAVIAKDDVLEEPAIFDEDGREVYPSTKTQGYYSARYEEINAFKLSVRD